MAHQAKTVHPTARWARPQSHHPATNANDPYPSTKHIHWQPTTFVPKGTLTPEQPQAPSETNPANALAPTPPLDPQPRKNGQKNKKKQEDKETRQRRATRRQNELEDVINHTGSITIQIRLSAPKTKEKSKTETLLPRRTDPKKSPSFRGRCVCYMLARNPFGLLDGRSDSG